jgi:hypothetical protein
MSSPAEHSGSGGGSLPLERTALSWRRTVLTSVIANFFIWRVWLNVMTRQDEADLLRVWALGVCALTAAATTCTIADCGRRRLRLVNARDPAAAATHIRRTAAAVLALAIAVVATICLSA